MYLNRPSSLLPDSCMFLFSGCNVKSLRQIKYLLMRDDSYFDFQNELYFAYHWFNSQKPYICLLSTITMPIIALQGNYASKTD